MDFTLDFNHDNSFLFLYFHHLFIFEHLFKGLLKRVGQVIGGGRIIGES